MHEKKNKYLATKIVFAEPSSCPKDDQQNKKGDEGYEVLYKDGYVSWSPKKAFEDANRLLDGEANFGLAVEAMKIGCSVRLPYWSEDVYLTIQVPDEHSKMTHPYIYVSSRFGLVPWVATQIEILSDKWVIIEK